MQQASIKQAFWDYNFTERQLLQKLENGTQVKDFFPYLHLRPKLKQIWGDTLTLWDKYEKDSH